VRVLLVSDLHYDLARFDWLLRRVADPTDAIDVAVIAGDLLDVASGVPLDTQITVILAYLERLAAVLPNPRRYSVARPGPYVARRAASIQRQMRQLGGVAYLATNRSLPALTAVTAAVLLAESAALIPALAWAFARFDPSLHTPGQ
jgi:hypothetical protein